MKERLRDRLLRRARPLDPRAQLGLFRRLTPIGREFGYSRGLPIDRYYVERHSARHAADIAGRVLEAGGGVQYGRTFGGDRVAHLDIMYPLPGFADQTLVADLVTGEGLPTDSYDCLILAQVFNYIYDLQAAVENARRALRPGGVLLATLSGISQMSPGDVETWGDYWRFTPMSAARLFGDAFGAENVEVTASGNVYVACAFLQCLATGDLTARELEHDDPDYPFSIAVRAVRAELAPSRGPGRPQARRSYRRDLGGRSADTEVCPRADKYSRYCFRVIFSIFFTEPQHRLICAAPSDATGFRSGAARRVGACRSDRTGVLAMHLTPSQRRPVGAGRAPRRAGATSGDVRR